MLISIFLWPCLHNLDKCIYLCRWKFEFIHINQEMSDKLEHIFLLKDLRMLHWEFENNFVKHNNDEYFEDQHMHSIRYNIVNKILCYYYQRFQMLRMRMDMFEHIIAENHQKNR